MFIKLNRLLRCLFIVTLSICSCQQSPYRDDTVVFNDYLNRHHFNNKVQDSVDYILISEFGCAGCIQTALNRLGNKKNTVFILTENTISTLSSDSNTEEKYKVDSSGEINRLKYHNRNIGVIRMSEKKIYNILFIEPNNIDSIISLLY